MLKQMFVLNSQDQNNFLLGDNFEMTRIGNDSYKNIEIIRKLNISDIGQSWRLPTY